MAVSGSIRADSEPHEPISVIGGGSKVAKHQDGTVSVTIRQEVVRPNGMKRAGNRDGGWGAWKWLLVILPGTYRGGGNWRGTGVGYTGSGKCGPKRRQEGVGWQPHRPLKNRLACTENTQENP